MKDGWRVAEPVLATQPMESPTLSEAAAVAAASVEAAAADLAAGEC